MISNLGNAQFLNSTLRMDVKENYDVISTNTGGLKFVLP